MRRGAKALGFTALLAMAGCGGNRPELTIRSTGKPPAAHGGPVSARVADGRAQLALGNVALALETFRRAVREEPRNIDAIAGLAASYDRMGRFDVSRRHYEAALAVEPANGRVLAALAASLDQQGKAGEAAAVRGEMRARGEAVRTASLAAAPVAAKARTVPATAAAPVAVAAAAVPAVAVVAVPPATAPAAPMFPTAPASAVTVMLPAPSPAVAAPRRPASAPEPAVAAPSRVAPPAVKLAEAAPEAGPRLERTSLAEVVLVTRPAAPPARLAALPSGDPAPSPRFVPLRAAGDRVAVRVLNAARVDRLAATMRSRMVRHGWRNILIGNAATTRARSIVLYPASLRLAARRLAAQLGLRSAVRAGRGEVTVLLGRDAAVPARRRAAS